MSAGCHYNNIVQVIDSAAFGYLFNMVQLECRSFSHALLGGNTGRDTFGHSEPVT